MQFTSHAKVMAKAVPAIVIVEEIVGDVDILFL
jgi:hypothetical protein